MGWESFSKVKTGSSNFVKLKAGESIEGVFAGEPHFFYQKFGDKAEYSDWLEGRSFKFKINFITKNKETNVLEVKIFQGGNTLRKSLLSVKEEYGLDCVYKIKREGSTKDDTTYSILFKSNLDDAQKILIKNVKLNVLVAETSKDLPPFNEEEDVPL